jgi:hypothetical protein
MDDSLDSTIIGSEYLTTSDSSVKYGTSIIYKYLHSGTIRQIEYW